MKGITLIALILSCTMMMVQGNLFDVTCDAEVEYKEWGAWGPCEGRYQKRFREAVSSEKKTCISDNDIGLARFRSYLETLSEQKRTSLLKTFFCK